MMKKILMMILIAVAAISFTGCKDTSDNDTQVPQVEIDEDQVQSELDKIEKEIDSDTVSE